MAIANPIAIDMDGNFRCPITPLPAAKMIAAARARGVNVVLTTGRLAQAKPQPPPELCRDIQRPGDTALL